MDDSDTEEMEVYDDRPFVRDQPRRALCTYVSGPNGETEIAEWTRPINWSDPKTINRLNKWKTQRRRRANEQWGIVDLKRAAIIKYTTSQVQWIREKLKDIPDLKTIGNLIPQYLATFPDPPRTFSALRSKFTLERALLVEQRNSERMNGAETLLILHKGDEYNAVRRAAEALLAISREVTMMTAADDPA